MSRATGRETAAVAANPHSPLKRWPPANHPRRRRPCGPFELAAAATGRWASDRQPTAVRAGTTGPASLRQPRLPPGPSRLGCHDGKATRAGVDTTPPRPAQTADVAGQEGFFILPIISQFGGWHLSCPYSGALRHPWVEPSSRGADNWPGGPDAVTCRRASVVLRFPVFCGFQPPTFQENPDAQHA